MWLSMVVLATHLLRVVSVTDPLAQIMFGVRVKTPRSPMGSSRLSERFTLTPILKSVTSEAKSNLAAILEDYPYLSALSG